VARQQPYWEDVQVGDEVPGYSLTIDPNRIVKQVSGSQDFYAVHYDVEFATKGGHPGIFVNTGFMQGCFNRLICSWIGDRGMLRKFRMEMRRMNGTGDVMSLKGKVTNKYVEGEDYLVECELWAENQAEGVTTPSYALVTLPSRSSNSQ
jgi:acyl dehydratase